MSIMFLVFVVVVSSVFLVGIINRLIMRNSRGLSLLCTLVFLLLYAASLYAGLKVVKEGQIVVLSTEPAQWDEYALLRMSESDEGCYMVNNRYCYLDSAGEICIGIADPSKVRVTNEDASQACVVVRKEHQICRKEWGIFYSLNFDRIEIVEYEFHIPESTKS